MNFFLRRNIRRGPWARWKRILLGAYVVMMPLSLYHYINWCSAATVAGLMALLFTPAFEEQPRGAFRYGAGSMFFFVLFILIPVKTILYLGMSCGVLFLWETWYGRVERTVPFVLLLLCPITDYLMNLFSFPIRLQLTSLAGGLMREMGMSVFTAGNLLTYNGHEFSVDPACMGLHMVQLSLLTGLVMMNFYQGRQGRRLGVVSILVLLVVILMLNIVANLFRIIGVVALCLLPGNPLHEGMGIFCLVLYVLLPMTPLIRWVVGRSGMPVVSSSSAGGPSRSPLLLAANWLVSGSMLIAVPISLQHDQRQEEPDKVPMAVPGYTIRSLGGHILQLNNDSSLIYIKPIPDFYYTDHLPTICWQGNGYSFHLVQEERIGALTLYTGLLQSEKDTLYTAWWYDNGSRRTTDQLEWRWDVVRGGGKYSIVNITTSTRKALEEETRRVLKTNPFREMLQQNRCYLKSRYIDSKFSIISGNCETISWPRLP